LVPTYTGERISKVSLAEKIAEKLSQAELQDRFMEVYKEIIVTG
jgi:hypothetical protein